MESYISMIPICGQSNYVHDDLFVYLDPAQEVIRPGQS